MSQKVKATWSKFKVQGFELEGGSWCPHARYMHACIRAHTCTYVHMTPDIHAHTHGWPAPHMHDFHTDKGLNPLAPELVPVGVGWWLVLIPPTSIPMGIHLGPPV